MKQDRSSWFEYLKMKSLIANLKIQYIIEQVQAYTF